MHRLLTSTCVRLGWLCACLAVLTVIASMAGTRTSLAATKSITPSEGSDGGATIYVVVNDTPITAYNIDQRIKLLSVDGSGGWQQRLQAKLKSPDIQARFKAFVMAHHPKSTQEIPPLQKAFIDGLRQQAMAEGRPGLRDKAASQLISETLEMQEAKRQSVLASDEELKAAIGEIAKRNKKTATEFESAIAATGVAIRAFRERIRAQMSWQRVLQTHFQGQIVVDKAELAQELAAGAGNVPGADGTVQLKLQRIVIPMRSSDAAGSVAGYQAADELRQRVKPCGNMADLAKSVPGGQFEDLGSVKLDSLGADVRPMLANAATGSVPPPIVSKSSITVYGVCEKGASDTNAAGEEAARNKIEHNKLEARARGLLSDLCAAASIDLRNGFTLANPCASE